MRTMRCDRCGKETHNPSKIDHAASLFRYERAAAASGVWAHYTITTTYRSKPCALDVYEFCPDCALEIKHEIDQMIKRPRKSFPITEDDDFIGLTD